MPLSAGRTFLMCRCPFSVQSSLSHLSPTDVDGVAHIKCIAPVLRDVGFPGLVFRFFGLDQERRAST